MTNLIALPSGTELVGDYRIERVLGAGGFGVTYLADEIALARLVTIKEYFPSDIAARTAGIEAAPRSQALLPNVCAYPWPVSPSVARRPGCSSRT
jgi:serine/threonine protein kinase